MLIRLTIFYFSDIGKHDFLHDVFENVLFLNMETVMLYKEMWPSAEDAICR